MYECSLANRCKPAFADCFVTSQGSRLAKCSQAIVLMNRRGFAPSLQCQGCSAILQCPVCSVSSTHHRTGGWRLCCHYCDREAPVPTTCPACGCPRIAILGVGTERLEEALASAFPQARIGVSMAMMHRVLAAKQSLRRCSQRPSGTLVCGQQIAACHAQDVEFDGPPAQTRGRQQVNQRDTMKCVGMQTARRMRCPRHAPRATNIFVEAASSA